MTVTVYRSTDPSAPTLSGTAGDLVNLLDAILVNGYGSGGTAKAAQGYTIAFTGTNKRSYKMPPGTNGHYLRVVDDGTTSAAYGRVQGYVNMTDVDTGTNGFPNPVSQIAQPGLYCWKNTAPGSTQRPWICYANGFIFHLVIFVDQTVITGANPVPGGFVFGQYLAYNLADPFNTILVGGTNAATPNVASSYNHQFCMACNYLATTGSQYLTGHYTPQNYYGLGGAQQVAKITNNGLLGGAGNAAIIGMGQGGTGGIVSSVAGANLQLPNPTDNAIYLERLWVIHPQGVILGELPGMWAPLQWRGFLNQGDTFAGPGSLSGKTFEVLGLYLGGYSSCAFMEISNTW